jgi:hypothetical protein
MEKAVHLETICSIVDQHACPKKENSLVRVHVALVPTGPRVESASDAHGPPAFVFDIDGVLIRGGTVLPAARRALAKLYSPGGWNVG